MKHIFTYLIVFIFISCGSVKKNSITAKTSKKQAPETVLPDSVEMIIQSTNLSEDMSSLSSNDDEIAILVYHYSDSIISSSPLLSDYFILNKNKMADTIHYADKITEQNNTIIFFLLEVDSDKKIGDIETSVRTNYKKLIKAYQKRDYTEIEKYIGDEDVIGIKSVEDLRSKRPVTIDFNDIYKMDRFSYTITLK